jgi:HD-GYP domain-containing protein (c-di-GMP phosphodiesterase class II)
MQFLRRMKVLSDACQVVRPVSISMIAIAVVACAMAIKGWQTTSAALGGVLAGIAGVLVFQVHRAVTHLNRESQTVRQAAREAERHYVGVLRRIIRFVEARDKYAVGRSERIGRLAEQLARKMRLPEDKCRLMSLAGQLHDIGLIAVPESILAKRSRLDREEFRTVQKHCEIAYEMLMSLESLRDVLPAIRYHHERMNGTGYPAERRGKEIPLEARILAVADAYDAMTHDRPYRSAMTPLEAMAELRRCSPAGYDPECTEAMAEIINLPELQDAMGASTGSGSPPAHR